MSDLIALETPLQLLNAAEAARHYPDDATLLILLTGDFSKRRFELLLDHLPARPWQRVRYLTLQLEFPVYDATQGSLGPAQRLVNARSKLLLIWNRIKLRATLRLMTWTLGTPRRVFVGNYLDDHKPYFRHIANAFRDSETVLLDDGTDTIIIAAQRCIHHAAASKQAVRQDSPESMLRWAENWLRSNVTHWDVSARDSVTFFSSFELKIHAPDRYVRHSYEALRPQPGTFVRSDEVWILGQCLPDDGYMPLSDYIECVRNLLKRAGTGKFIYVAHPRESEKTLGAVAALPGVEIRHFDIPIELALLRTKSLPATIASFFSTALVNIGLIFGDSMDIQSYILEGAILSKNHEQVANIYATMRSMQLSSLRFISSRPSLPSTLTERS